MIFFSGLKTDDLLLLVASPVVLGNVLGILSIISVSSSLWSLLAVFQNSFGINSPQKDLFRITVFPLYSFVRVNVTVLFSCIILLMETLNT